MGWLKALLGRALVLGLVTAAGAVTGYYYAQASAAEARTEAVMAATAEAERRYSEAVVRAAERARTHAERVEELRADLKSRTRALEDYARSESGQEMCLDPDGVEQFNAL